MGHPKQIMVVDGSEVARTIIGRILEAQMDEAAVTTCASAAEALEHLEQRHFDLLTTALMLPDLDGLDLCRRIRASSSHYYTPVIVVSSDADSRLLREGFDAGVTDWFDKSLGYQAFADFVKDFSRRNAGLVGRVLYVEDSRTAATVTRHILEKHGLQVVHTTTAEQALALLEEGAGSDEDYDVVVTDFYLKGDMTGGDLLHTIRAKLHYSQQEMPVLVLTGNDGDKKQAEVFHAGANDFVTKPLVEEILVARLRSLLLIKQQFNALKRQAETMQRLATIDSLTGVRNKRYLLDHGDELMAEARRPLCAMLVDIDHFKEINDGLGHITGDHVLEGLGRLLNRTLPEGALAVRFGGEEFAILAPSCGVGAGHELAERLRRAVGELRPAGVDVTVSLGIASTEAFPEADLTRLLSLADEALYAAKARGRNCVFTLSAEGEAVPDPLSSAG